MTFRHRLGARTRSQVERAGQRHAGPVDEVPVRGGVDDGDVRPGSHAQMTDVVAPQRRAAPRVAASSASSVVMPISRTASARQNGIDDVYDVPGLQSVASATGTPASSSRRASGYGRPGRELDTGQQGRDGGATLGTYRIGEGVDVGVAEVGAVIDARGAELDGEGHPGTVPELVAVHAREQPGADARAQHGPRLVGVEGVRRAGLAEHVDPAGVGRAGRRACRRRRGRGRPRGRAANSAGTTCAPR